MALKQWLMAALGMGTPAAAPATEQPLTRDASDFYGFGLQGADRRWALSSVDDLTLRQGIARYREMMADDLIASCMEQIRVAVISAPLEITPASNEQEDVDRARFLRDELDYLEEQTVDDVVTAILEGLWLGVSCQEIVGRAPYTSGEWAGKSGTAYFNPVLRESFTIHVDQFGRISPDGVWQAKGHVAQIGEDPANYEQFPRDRFVIWSWRRLYNNRLGWSMLRQVHGPWQLKQHLALQLGRYMELHAVPIMIGKVPPESSATAMATVLDQMRQLQVSRRGVFKDNVDLSFEAPVAASSNASFETAFAIAERMIMRGLMNPSLLMDTKDSGPAGSSGKQEDTFLRMIRALHRSIAKTLQKQWAEPLIARNWGDDAACPVLGFTETDSATILAQIERVERAVKLGLEVGVSTLREITSIPEPSEGEPLLEVSEQPKSSLPGAMPGEDAGDVEEADVPEEMMA